MSPARLEEVEAAGWDALLERLGITDVYCSRGFVAASAALAGAVPLLLHLAGDGGDVVFACLLRSDPTDVVTPYGYGGPVASGAAPPLAAFRDAYAEWCAARGVVSTFVVFHPLFANHRHAAEFGFHDAALAGTVAWPLGAPDLLAAMHKHHRRLVRRAQREGLTAGVRTGPADLDEFVPLYEDAMRRLDAAPSYLFPPSYWDGLLRDVPLVEVTVRDGDGRLAAAVLGMGRPPWLHYHLGAASGDGRGTGASHLALLTLAQWGAAHGYDTLHLGGGVGGRADALLTYKLRFAPDGLVAAHLGKAVHDTAAYAALTGSPEIDWDGYFPAYRRP